jgi:hypothetical protein
LAQSFLTAVDLVKSPFRFSLDFGIQKDFRLLVERDLVCKGAILSSRVQAAVQKSQVADSIDNARMLWRAPFRRRVL